MIFCRILSICVMEIGATQLFSVDRSGSCCRQFRFSLFHHALKVLTHRRLVKFLLFFLLLVASLCTIISQLHQAEIVHVLHPGFPLIVLSDDSYPGVLEHDVSGKIPIPMQQDVATRFKQHIGKHKSPLKLLSVNPREPSCQALIKGDQTEINYALQVGDWWSNVTHNGQLCLYVECDCHSDVLHPGLSDCHGDVLHPGLNDCHGDVLHPGLNDCHGDVLHPGLSDCHGDVLHPGLNDCHGDVLHPGLNDCHGDVLHPGLNDCHGDVLHPGLNYCHGDVLHPGLNDCHGVVLHPGLSDCHGVVLHPGLNDCHGVVLHPGLNDCHGVVLHPGLSDCHGDVLHPGLNDCHSDVLHPDLSDCHGDVLHPGLSNL
ncbi:hypothetical protein Btru_019025 [Bulinus truncatus]|nr:hypothetical protein Btru_019025 [Bulinus truncatus]